MSINRFKSALTGFGLLLFAFNASAYPLLTFDGVISYNAESRQFAAGGRLTGSQDISPAPQLAGSIFQFSSQLDSVSTNSFGTVASFTGTTSGSSPLLNVMDGDGSTTLLRGELTGLTMGGLSGSNTGSLLAQFSPTSGTLLNEFAVGAKLFSLQVNLATKFGSSMFLNSFGGKIDGRLYAPASVSVPEPGVLILLMLGLGIIVITARTKSGQKFSYHDVS